MSINQKTIIAGTVAAIVLYLFFKDQAAAALKAVGNAVNPTSDQNLAYQGTNAVGIALSGDKDWTLGGWLYDVTHPNPLTGDSRKQLVSDQFYNKGYLQ